MLAGAVPNVKEKETKKEEIATKEVMTRIGKDLERNGCKRTPYAVKISANFWLQMLTIYRALNKIQVED